MKKININDTLNLKNIFNTIVKPFEIINRSNLYIDNNVNTTEFINIIIIKIKKYIKGPDIFLSYKTVESDNGFTVQIKIIDKKIGLNGIEIKIFSSTKDFYRDFAPLEKLNRINEFYNVVKLIDYSVEEKTLNNFRYPFYIQEKLLYFNEILDLLFINPNLELNINIKMMREIFVTLFKSFFRTIFVLYLKNDQINTKFSIKNFGSNITLKEINNNENLEIGRFYASNFIGSVSKSFYPATDSKIYDRRYLFLSFENFRRDLLKYLYTIEIKVKKSRVELFDKCIRLLKRFYENFDIIMTDTFESDKISEIGGIKIGEFKTFKFLNYDDIIKNVRNRFTL